MWLEHDYRMVRIYTENSNPGNQNIDLGLADFKAGGTS